ncbi:MAG: sensor histidine kinase [Intrasporangium sp.]|uniref:sensor histidine kinase n=1 Tax=Intrasporangium sp. TaxID=1925024 RepID=UPI003F7FC714
MAAATLGGIVGLALGGVATFAMRWSDRSDAAQDEPRPETPLPPGAAEVLAVLGSSAIVLDTSDRVVNNSPAAVAHGLVRGAELVHPELLEMARRARRDGVIREKEFELRKGPLGAATTVVGARVAPLGGDHVLLLVEDRSRARRVEEIRRDFLANVSHELKTPVGGISLLAEAILDAHDDPAVVKRFAQRIGGESERLTRLVREIVDLSRLTGEDVIKDPVLVDVGACAVEAVDASEVLAEERGIELRTEIGEGCLVWGEADLVTTAIGNLVGNAIAYSESGTRVSVRVQTTEDLVDVAVTDQGVGIDADEHERIFERFYRVDTARSRATGGTGLGLAIVKHVAENHGGQVCVWSEPGRGSTFTIRMPLAAQEAGRPTPEAAATARSTPPAPPELSTPA